MAKDRGTPYHNGTRIAYCKYEDSRRCVHGVDGEDPCAKCEALAARDKLTERNFFPRKRRRKMDSNDWCGRGFIMGTLYSAIKTLGHIDGNIALSASKAKRVMGAAKIVNDVYNELLEENRKL